MDQQNNNEELDLVWLFKAFYAKCEDVKDWMKCKVRHALRFAWKKRIALIVAFVLGAGLGVAQSIIEDYYTKYTLESLAFMKSTSADVCDDLLESLNLFCKKKNYSKVAQEMGYVDEENKVTDEGLEIASKLKKVNAYFWIDDRHSGAPTEVDKKDRYLKDTSVVRIYDRLQIEIEVSDLSAVDTLKSGLIHYLSSNEEVKKNHESRRELLSAMKDQYNAEAGVLDSLRRQEYFSESNRKKTMQIDGPMIVSESNRQLFHDDILKLKNKSFDCEIELKKKGTSVYFNRDFAITKSSSKVLTLSLLYGGILFVLAFFILGLLDKRKSIKEYLEAED
ncbi:MAG: hypothetical protein KBT22_08440 [Bacteroidales bacterium]|nr:hypothetical protein [Candidatus Scybalocola fimicaballi]